MTTAARHTLVDLLNGAPWDELEGFSTATTKSQPPTDFNLSSLPQPPRGRDAKVAAPSDPDYYTDKELKKQNQRELLAYLRSIHFAAPDADVSSLGHNDHSFFDGIIANQAAALQSVPVTSVYGAGGVGPGGTQPMQRPCADSLGQYNDRIAQPFYSYIKSRITTAITLYPLLVSRGIETVSQLRRISNSEIEIIRHSLCRGDAQGTGLYMAFLAKLQQDAVEPSLDGLEVARATAVGSGAFTRVDAHFNAAVGVDRRPVDASLRWQQRAAGGSGNSKAVMSVVCKLCAPATFDEDVQKPRLNKQGVVCPRPPYVAQMQREERQELEEDRQRAIAARNFVPRKNAVSGHVFKPGLTTLLHSLVPQNVLPEDTDESLAAGGTRRANMRLPKAISELTGDDAASSAEQYDPFRNCRSANTFTLDEIALTNKLIVALKEALMNQYHRAMQHSPDTAREEPRVDSSTVLTAATLGAAFSQLGVPASAAAVFQGAVLRGRLGSSSMSMRRGSSVGLGGLGGSGNFGRRGSSAMGPGMGARRGSAAAAATNAATTTTTTPARRGSTVRAAASAGGAAPGLTSSASSGKNIKLNRQASIALNRTASSTRRGSRYGSMDNSPSPPSPTGSTTGRRGISITDLATFIEQRLDAVKFLKAIFCRFSRSTPWIIFRHEIDEAIRSRVTGIGLILQLMDAVNADILPFERFCSEAGRGKLAVTFTETFLADAIIFCAESGSGLGGKGTRQASAMRRGESTASLVSG